MYFAPNDQYSTLNAVNNLLCVCLNIEFNFYLKLFKLSFDMLQNCFQQKLQLKKCFIRKVSIYTNYIILLKNIMKKFTIFLEEYEIDNMNDDISTMIQCYKKTHFYYLKLAKLENKKNIRCKMIL